MIRQNGKSWSGEKVAEVRALLAAGQTQQQVAAKLGCSPSNISKRLKSADDTSAKQIYELRSRGFSFYDIAERLDMKPCEASMRRLYMRLVRYCERSGLTYPRAGRAKTAPPSEPAPYVFDETQLFRVSFFIRRRAGRGQAIRNTDVADGLGLSDREAKFYIAELRRRNVLSNGIVPTQQGIDLLTDAEPPDYARFDVLRAIVEAWTSGAPCETLRSLREKLPYSPSTVNLAIVQLRDEGLVAPRGYLYPRGRRHE